MAELKILPCPFCGHTASVETMESRVGARYSVGCDNPDIHDCMGYQSLTSFGRRADAIEAWNRRAPAPVPEPIPFEPHPLELEGVTHDSNCNVWCTPPGIVFRRPCSCGANSKKFNEVLSNIEAGAEAKKPYKLTKQFQRMVKELRGWRDTDRADAITLHRTDIIELVEGITTLTHWAGDNDRYG